MNCNSHAPQGTKLASSSASLKLSYCNSHAPQGTKLVSTLTVLGSKLLQLTRPTGDETPFQGRFWKEMFIATHTPHRGRNPTYSACRCFSSILQLTRPTGDETPSFCVWHFKINIATHTPHRGRNSGFFSSDLVSSDCNSHAPQGTKQET